MNDNPKKNHRRSIRLKGYDYSQPGVYFVTICSWNRECLFDDIVDGKMRLNEFGVVVQREWMRTGIVRSNITLDQFIIMPNHLHGILIIHDDRRGTLQRALAKWIVN